MRCGPWQKESPILAKYKKVCWCNGDRSRRFTASFHDRSAWKGPGVYALDVGEEIFINDPRGGYYRTVLHIAPGGGEWYAPSEKQALRDASVVVRMSVAGRACRRPAPKE
jgi:hypothetical protein